MVNHIVTENLNTKVDMDYTIGDAPPPEARHVAGEDGGLLCDLALPVSAKTLSLICCACLASCE